MRMEDDGKCLEREIRCSPNGLTGRDLRMRTKSIRDNDANWIGLDRTPKEEQTSKRRIGTVEHSPFSRLPRRPRRRPKEQTRPRRDETKCKTQDTRHHNPCRHTYTCIYLHPYILAYGLQPLTHTPSLPDTHNNLLLDSSADAVRLQT